MQRQLWLCHQDYVQGRHVVLILPGTSKGWRRYTRGGGTVNGIVGTTGKSPPSVPLCRRQSVARHTPPLSLP